MQTYALKLTNKISELDKIRDSLEELVADWGLPPAEGMSVNLALEEAFTNIVNYAFEDEGLHEIEMAFSLKGDELMITITDDGKHYDPTKHADPDTGLPAADRPIGGLGIFLIRKIMDEVHYQRKGNVNQLILTKNIKQ